VDGAELGFTNAVQPAEIEPHPVAGRDRASLAVPQVFKNGVDFLL
jgi:hypothetical protein